MDDEIGVSDDSGRSTPVSGLLNGDKRSGAERELPLTPLMDTQKLRITRPLVRYPFLSIHSSHPPDFRLHALSVNLKQAYRYCETR